MARTHYTTVEGVSLAYQVLSEEGPTVLSIPGAISNMALDDMFAPSAYFFERMARFARVVRFDKRGTGLSDRTARVTTIEQQLNDVKAVLDATNTEQATLVGLSHGVALAILFAVTYPERVERLILVDGFCCDARDPNHPMDPANTIFDWDNVLDLMEHDFERWVEGFALIAFPPDSGVDANEVVQFLIATASPAAFRHIWRGMRGMDLRPMLRQIAVPTLVLHATREECVPVAHGRYLAEHIAGAQIIEFDTSAHVPWANTALASNSIATIEEFMTGRATETGERIFTCILFTDIVGSTAQQQAMGDAAWRDIRVGFENVSGLLVQRFGGRIVEFTGDGILGSFPVPGDALRAARGLVSAAEEMGIEIRAGLQAGEAYVLAEQLSGTSVTVAARVMAQANASEIFTTETVQDLVAGSGFQFEPAGEFDLKGIGTRRLVRLT